MAGCERPRPDARGRRRTWYWAAALPGRCRSLRPPTLYGVDPERGAPRGRPCLESCIGAIGTFHDSLPLVGSASPRPLAITGIIRPGGQNIEKGVIMRLKAGRWLGALG